MTNDGPLDALALAAVAAVTGAWPKHPDLFETKCGLVYEYVFSRADDLGS